VDAPEGSDGSLRLCAATRVERSPDELMRFVAAPDGEIVPDLSRRLPGRGVWVSAEKPAVAQAVRDKVFAKSLKRPVQVPADLADRVEHLLEKRLCESLSLANKAGLVTTGYQQVDALLDKGQVSVLVEARDAAETGREKLERKHRAIAEAGGRNTVIVKELTIEQISLAMGRLNVVHAALIQGGATEKLAREAKRLRRYRSGALASEC
jgi:hypothetical protein